ncbi:MFS transporter [uncultured Serinicoccus sp.]|uniref:MFS transporter n=1 Tax=uncultured Serinicoccus sp. TaxID=735514 RepID=UPI0026129551|nr:MFS transporter [uncultured Serinicoccus sp.]
MTGDEPPRGPGGLAFDPTFGPFFWARLVSITGIWIHNITAALVVFQISGSVSLVAAVSVAQFLPQLLLSAWSGAWADRGHMGRQIVLGRLVTAAGSVLLATWIWAVGGVENLPGIWVVIVASTVAGIGFVIGGPAMQSIAPSITRQGEISAAMALNSLTMTVARAIGPLLGGVAAHQLGPAGALMIAGSGSVFFALVGVAIRLPAGPGVGATDGRIRAAVAHVLRDRRLLSLLAGTAAVGLAAEPTMTLAPSFAELWGIPAAAGWLASAFGVGAVLVSALLSRLQRHLSNATITSIGLSLMAFGNVGLALGDEPWIGLSGMGVSGAGMTLALTGITTQIQVSSPRVMLGRIMSLWFMAFLGSRPFAAALLGFTADAFSVPVSLYVTAALTLAAATVCWLALREHRN